MGFLAGTVQQKFILKLFVWQLSRHKDFNCVLILLWRFSCFSCMYKSVKWRKYQLHFGCYQQNNFVSISVSFTCQNFIDYSYSFSLLSHDLNATSAEQLALLCVNTRWLLRHISGVYVVSGIWYNIWKEQSVDDKWWDNALIWNVGTCPELQPFTPYKNAHLITTMRT